jgi:signal transduction histidine kinase
MENWKDPTTLITWISLIILFVLILVGAILMIGRNYIRTIKKEEQIRTKMKMQAKQDLLVNSIKMQEEERTRIAADLHDNLISKLNIIRLTTAKGDKSVTDKITDCMEIARKISHDLTPAFIEECSLQELVDDLLNEIPDSIFVERHYSIQRDFELSSKLHLYRITQELLHNILKYANASKICLFIRDGNSHFSFKISDDGGGIIPNKKKGLGLNNIELRTQILEGKNKFKSNPGFGTTFLFQAPINKQTL